jgi:hypothetical protein
LILFWDGASLCVYTEVGWLCVVGNSDRTLRSVNMTATTTDGHGIRRAETEVRVFQASPELAASLQRVLIDLIELHL